MTPAGFPHSEIFGSKGVCPSPKLIAACRVLRRLPVPRHPPCALGIFFRNQSSCFGWVIHIDAIAIVKDARSLRGASPSASVIVSFRVITLCNCQGARGAAPKPDAENACLDRCGRTPCTRTPIIRYSSVPGGGAFARPLPDTVSCLPRKEVIQPHLPVRLPCYDFTPLTLHTFDASAPIKGSAGGFGCRRLGWCDGRCVQGPGTYSPRHADPRLLATPTSRRRVAASDPNWDRL